MKNRVLSVLLSIGIILSNCSTGFIAIAEDENPVSTETTETNEPTTEPTDVPSTDDPTANENEEDDPNTQPDENPDDNVDDNPVEDDRIAISVSKAGKKELTVYYGQDTECLNTIYNAENNQGKPRYSEYFKFDTDDWGVLTLETLIQNVELNFEQVTGDSSNENVEYKVNFSFKENNLGLDDTYVFDYDKEFTYVITDYSPNDISMETTIDNGKFFLTWSDTDYSVSLSNEAESFIIVPVDGESAKIEFDEATDTIYYLRNVNESSIAYQAISIGYSINIDSNVYISETAIIQNDVNFYNNNAYHNGKVKFKVTASAMSKSAIFSIQNIDAANLTDVATQRIGDKDGKNLFEYTFSVNAPQNGSTQIDEIVILVKAGENTANKTLKIQNKDNICNALIIDTKKPDNFNPVWGKDRDDNGQKVIPFTVSEYETEIVKIEYRYGNDMWSLVNDVRRSGSYYTFDFRTDCQSLYTKNLFLRAVDAAGNERYCIRKLENGGGVSWIHGPSADDYIKSASNIDTSIYIDAIDSIELWYTNSSKPADDDWIELKDSAASEFHTYKFGNAINKKYLQIRVRSESESTFYFNQNLFKEHKIQIDSNDDGENDKTIVDYYYYTIESGTSCDAMISIKNQNVRISLDSLKEKFDKSIKIESSIIVVEDVKPTSNLKCPELVANKWYGIEAQQNGAFVIEVSDTGSGIGSIYLSDDGKEIVKKDDFLPKYSISEGDYKDFGHTSDEFNLLYFKGLDSVVKNVKIDIPIGLFNDGNHTLEITVYDNAGNKETGFAYIMTENKEIFSTNYDSENKENIPFTFSTDFTPPKGEIKIGDKEKPGTNIYEELWFNSGETVAISFTIEDIYPLKVEWSAEGDNEIKIVPYKDEEGNLYILPATNNKISVNDTSDKIKSGMKNNSYIINAVFYDQAGNSSRDIEDGDKVEQKTFYKDTSAPMIESVSVSCAPETGLGKVLRILTFGIFAKDTITITVKAYDAINDSGLSKNSLKLSLGGNDIPIENGIAHDDNEKGEVWEYTYQTNKGDIPQSGVIKLIVTDNIGKTISEFDKIEAVGEIADESLKFIDVDDKHPANFVIETTPPTVNIDLPESDGIPRADEEKWYNWEKEKDKKVKITVIDGEEDSDSNTLASGLHRITIFVNDIELDRSFMGDDIVWNQDYKDNKKHTYEISLEYLRNVLAENNQLPQYGDYTIKVKAEDNACNVNDIEKDSKTYYIDDIAPTVQKIDFSIPSADEIDEINEDDIAKYVTELKNGYGYYFKTDLVATVHVHDDNPTSDLYAIKYMLVDYSSGNYNQELPAADSDAWQLVEVVSNPENKNDATASFNVHENFKGQIFVMVYDKVLNVSDIGTPDLFVVDTPERHESEQHIEITGIGETAFTDAENHPLFSSDVHLTVRVVDTMSGIREISYALTSENDTQDNKTITLENSGYSEGDDLGDGWIVKSMDENLVTEVERNYTFSADNNNIQLSIGMKDRSNNPSTEESDVFSVDQTAPVINVAFDAPAGNADCYREARTATITVIERNFDSARIIADIQNSFGNVPSIGTFTDASNTEHTATITFSEGDYTFSIAGTDRCDHNATINYSGGNEQSFKVDLTDPRVVHNFDQFVNSADNSFNTDKEMTITITEHNFVASLVSIRIYRTKAGQELTTTNREDCTSEYITPDKWRSNGDTHTISFTFSADYVYQVMIGGTDASGRMIPDNQSQVFEIDKTKPVLKNPKNLDVLVYTSKNTETEAKAIEFEDSNIARVDYSVVSYQMKINEDKVGYDMAVNSKKFESKNGSVIISNEFFNQDGIYEVKCTPYDVAGNAGDETTHTYVIQRDTDFLVYIPNSIKENRTGLYKFDQTGIRSADFEDIQIISYITNDKTFSVEVDGVEVTGNDLDSKLDDRRINQVNMYDVTVKNSYIAQNFSEDTVDTDLTLNAVAKNGDTAQVITLGHIYIDNVKPMGEYEKALQDIGFFDGFYGVESKTLMIEGVSPDIDLSRCEILVNDESLTYENGGFQYDENAHTISFTINKGYTNIRPTLVDNAGNINNLAMIKKVYVGNLFARFWYLFIFGGLIVIAIPTLAIWLIVRKKKTKRAF